MEKFVFAINIGSSTIKFELFRVGSNEPESLLRGNIGGIGQHKGVFKVWRKDVQSANDENVVFDNHAEALTFLNEWLKKNLLEPVDCICHRIVHGGPEHYKPTVITPVLIESLRSYISFAPEHLPNSLLAIESISQLYPEVTQLACFDTAFHWNMPKVAKNIALPKSVTRGSIRKYGFHGLSYEYIYAKLECQYPDIRQKRIVIAHLGSGASMVAITSGEGQDTSMGFTPAGGFMMGSRTGDMDPGVLIYLLGQMNYSAQQLNELVNHQSGLKGVSGISGDMQVLLQRQATDIHAKEAIELFCYQAKKQLGALIAVLGGLDILVFTGGIGEKAPLIRNLICNNMEFAGVLIGEQLNNENEAIISTAGATVTIHVMATSEERMMAEHAIKLISKK